MEPLLKIVRMGVFASLQDAGRFGYRCFGIPVSGPMDRAAFELGHKVLGNASSAVSLELFRGGFVFEALRRQTYVLSGAMGEYLLNGRVVPCWKTFVMERGDLLEIRQTVRGQIVYLTPAGGFFEELQLESRAAYRPAGLGRELKSGTVLGGGKSVELERVRGLYSAFVPMLVKPFIRVYKGPQFDLFDKASQRAFFETSYRFEGGNRMGYHVRGAKLMLKEPKNMLSSATLCGTIQVPSSGQPIVLMADAQTVGGYPVIATVHPDDVRFIAQLHLFDEVHFVEVK